jgi:putative endonuclease
MFFVYAIRSCIDGRFYVGQTQDMAKRLAFHNSGRVASTRKGCPWVLHKCMPCETRSDARWLERQLKASRGKRLRWLRT